MSIERSRNGPSIIKNTGILLVAAGLYRVSVHNELPVLVRYGLRAASIGVGFYGFSQSCKEAYGAT